MKIYTTGAFIENIKLPNGKYYWIITEFEDDSFNENGDWVDPIEESDLENHIADEDDDKS